MVRANSTSFPSLAFCLCVLALGCDKADQATDSPAETPAAAAESAPKAQAPSAEPSQVAPDDDPVNTDKPAEPDSLAGTYVSGEIKLTLSEVTDKGFTFQLSSPSAEGDDEEDPCGGISYKGSATFAAADGDAAPTKATTEFEESMVFTAGSVSYEPSDEMIGMDCMRVLDTVFKKSDAAG